LGSTRRLDSHQEAGTLGSGIVGSSADKLVVLLSAGVVLPSLTSSVQMRLVGAPPDGYTLLLANGANTINATLYDRLNFAKCRGAAPFSATFTVSDR
jgi:hypothetical protein